MIVNEKAADSDGKILQKVFVANEKISNLSRILPSLEGKSGTLEMAEFTPDTGMVTFTEKK